MTTRYRLEKSPLNAVTGYWYLWKYTDDDPKGAIIKLDSLDTCLKAIRDEETP